MFACSYNISPFIIRPWASFAKEGETAWRSAVSRDMSEKQRKLLSDSESADLCELWSRRADLNQAEWQRLWSLVSRVLLSFSHPQLRHLSESVEDYIAEYFAVRVFRERYNDSYLAGPAVLINWFRCFLTDISRKEIRKTFVSVGSAEDAERLGGKVSAGKATWNDSFEEDSIGETIVPESGTSSPDPSVHEGKTESFDCGCGEPEHGMPGTDRALLQSALSFFRSLTEIDQLYLALHACDADGEPLYKLAERFSIASYHYKAGQLGITRKKGELHEGYEHTKIGSWLANTLRIRIVPENIDLVLDAFQALCTAAFLVKQDLRPKEVA